MKCVLSVVMVMLLSPVLARPVETASPETQRVLALPLQRLQTADYRAVGHLVHVDVKGSRTSVPILLKVHWFPNVLRVWCEMDAPGQGRIHFLLEMRPDGQSSIRIAHPGDKVPSVLPFEEWNRSPVKSLAPGFDFEDFLDSEYFWPSQSVSGNAKFGARNCDLLTSVPGGSDHTHYAKVKSWLDHVIGYPVYVEKTLKGTGTTKEFTYFGLRQNGGVWSASQVEERTHGQDGSTLLIIERGSTKANLDLKDFRPEELTRF